MPRVVSAKEFLDLAFPLKGNDAANEFWRQADLTTARGVNVRAEEPVGMNARGGQRMGLVRFIDDLVAGPGDVVQHLNVVVDPQARALNADTDQDGSPPDYVPDPSTNNLTDRGGTRRYVPPRGSGRPPNRNIPGPAADIVLRQSKISLAASTSLSFSFDAPPLVGSVLVVFAVTGNLAVGSIPSSVLLDSVRNGSLLDYANVGGTGYYAEVGGSPAPGPADDGVKFAASMWWLKAAGGGDQDIVVSAGSSANIYAGAMEFTGSTATSALDAFNRWTEADVQLVNPETTHTGAAPTAGAAGEWVVACFGSQSSDATPTPLNGYVLAESLGVVVNLFYKTGVSPGLVPVPEITMTSGGVYGPTDVVSQFGVSATFKKN